MTKVANKKRSKRSKARTSLESDRGVPQKSKPKTHSQCDYDFILASDYEAMEKSEESIYRRAEEIINRA